MTDRTLKLRPLAQADIDAILAYLCAEGGPRLAGKFAQLLEDALRALATHPAIGSRLSALRGPAGIPGLRSWPIKQSAYLIVMDEQHSLTAASYVERNPLRARLCARPQDWPWSSGVARLAAGDDALASVRPFLDLVPNWAAFICEDEDDSFNALVRGHASAGRPLGSDAFVASLGRQLNRSLKRKKPRPKIQQRDKRNLDLFGNAKRS